MDLAYYLVDMVSYQGDLESFPVVVLIVALPLQSQSGPNDVSTFVQRLNTGKTGGTSTWLVPCPGTDCVKLEKSTYQ